MSKHQRSKNVVLWAVRMSSGTFISRILGFIRDLLIVTLFSRTQTDIFLTAFRFPNFFRRLLGEGSFSASVTPVLTEVLHQQGEEAAKKISSSLSILLFFVTSTLTLLGVFFMPDMIALFFGDSAAFSLVQGKLEQTVIVGRVVFAYLFLVSFYSYFMSVAQVFGRFFLPALAPALFNFSLIAFAITPQHWWPFPAISLAWAVLVGGVLQLTLVLYVVYSLGFWPRFYFNFRSAGFLAVLKRFVPVVIGLSGLSLIGSINLYFAGWLEEGTITYIYIADRLFELPRSLIAISIGTALIPELSKFYTLKKHQAFIKTASYYLNFLLFLTLPCAVVFWMLPEPIIQLLFQRGQFDEKAIQISALILKIYSVVLIFSSVARVFSSSFFAANKNWHVAYCNLFYVACHAVLAWWLTSAYGLEGLIWSVALSTMLYAFTLILLMTYSIGKISWLSSATFLFKISPGLILFTACLLVYPFLISWLEPLMVFKLAQALALFLSLSLAFTSYIGAGLFFKAEGAYDLLSLLTRKKLEKS